MGERGREGGREGGKKGGREGGKKKDGGRLKLPNAQVRVRADIENCSKKNKAG